MELPFNASRPTGMRRARASPLVNIEMIRYLRIRDDKTLRGKLAIKSHPELQLHSIGAIVGSSVFE